MLDIKYDKKRTDITFCTMLFRMPDEKNLNAIKGANRKFNDFYLQSLKRLIETFERVALWCDPQTAEFMHIHGLDKYVEMRVMKFSQLPGAKNRDENLEILRNMKKYPGYMMKNKNPESWVDYLPMMMTKSSVIKWAADNNKFNSDYFMWIDAGCFNDMYEQLWDDWTGKILAKPERCRFCVTPELVKPRPKFMPAFIYKIIKKIRGSIPDMTARTVAKQSMRDIVMVNADYEVPGGAFIIPKNLVSKFCKKFTDTQKEMYAANLIGVDQSVFLQMIKADTTKMFEVCYIKGYNKLYTKIAQKNPDYLF